MMNNKKKGTATIVSEKVYHLEASLPSGRKESGQKGQNLVTSLGSFASKWQNPNLETPLGSFASKFSPFSATWRSDRQVESTRDFLGRGFDFQLGAFGGLASKCSTHKKIARTIAGYGHLEAELPSEAPKWLHILIVNTIVFDFWVLVG